MSTELTAVQKQQLSSIYDGGVLKTILTIIEDIATESENKLIGEVPGNNESILALHAIAHAQSLLLIEVTNRIAYIVSETRGTN